MIDLVVKVVASELNEFFRLKFGIKEDRVIISNLVNQDGSRDVQQSVSPHCHLDCCRVYDKMANRTIRQTILYFPCDKDTILSCVDVTFWVHLAE